jgi:uncharacterized membrane protein
MLWFGRRQWIRAIDVPRIERAIGDAERGTSGEIRVSIAPFFWGSVERAASKAFDRLGMAATREHNGVLLFLVPSRRRFAILGDSAIHDRVGRDFWERAAEAASAHFRRGELTEGIVRCIAMIGEQLARNFPRDPTGVNELPDAVDLDRR